MLLNADPEDRRDIGDAAVASLRRWRLAHSSVDDDVCGASGPVPASGASWRVPRRHRNAASPRIDMGITVLALFIGVDLVLLL